MLESEVRWIDDPSTRAIRSVSRLLGIHEVQRNCNRENQASQPLSALLVGQPFNG